MDRKWGREREAMTCSKWPQGGIELGATAVWTQHTNICYQIQSTHGPSFMPKKKKSQIKPKQLRDYLWLFNVNTILFTSAFIANRLY